MSAGAGRGVVDHGQGDHIDEAIAAARAGLPADAAAEVGTERRASLLLAHQPLAADSAAALGVTAQLAGHTHGGQVWPVHWFAATKPASCTRSYR